MESYCSSILKTRLLLTLLLTLPFQLFAQMPECDKIYFDEVDPLTGGTNLYVYNPQQPLSAANPALNTIQLPAAHNGLAISPVLGSADTSLTYYTLVNGEYTYYNPVSASWIPTGHFSTDPLNAAVNLGAGGGFIFNLNGIEGKIYRYNGTGDDTLILTDPEFNGVGTTLQDRPFDLIADCEGSFFLFNATGNNHPPFLKKYDSAGVLLQQWTVANPITQGTCTGFAILGDTLYVGSANAGNEIWSATFDNAQVTIGNAPMVINTVSPGDMATCGNAIRLRPEVVITANPGDSLCGQSPVTFTANVLSGGTNSVYQWLVNGLPVGGNDTSYSYTPADGDQIKCVYKGQGACSSEGIDTSNVIHIVISQPFQTDFIYTQPYCNLSIVFTATDNNSAYSYGWNFGDGSAGAGSPAEHTYAAQGTWNVTLVATHGACHDTVTKAVTVNESNFQLSNILPAADTAIRYGDKIQLNASGAYTYSWSPARWLDSPAIANPIGRPLEPTTYTVIGVDENGCIDSVSRRVDIIYPPRPTIPSAFSPNGDGLNDVFRIYGQYFKVVTFHIFDRWGKEVFYTIDPDKGWDGTYKGAPADVGVYFYEAQIESADKQSLYFKGDVTLIR